MIFQQLDLRNALNYRTLQNNTKQCLSSFCWEEFEVLGWMYCFGRLTIGDDGRWNEIHFVEASFLETIKHSEVLLQPRRSNVLF